MDLNINANLSAKSAPSFGRMDFSNGAQKVLKNVLKPQEWQEFQEIVAKYNTDENGIRKMVSGIDNVVDINFFGKGKKKLQATIISNNRFIDGKYRAQKFYQSVMGFIRKTCKKADKIQAEVDKVKDIDVDKILTNI